MTGESGTGKELVAHAVHAVSPRRDAPFVSINCGALPETLFESELFGHVKGAFTDAHQHKEGPLRGRPPGTLFLDEVGEMPASMQVKLLRALQERRIRRVGGDRRDRRRRAGHRRHQPRRRLPDRGGPRLRQDLFYRLNVIHIHVPPLRERREDIPVLAQHFVERLAREMGKSVERVSPEALARLERHAWPGNVRELENVVERAFALETTEAVLAERLPESLLHRSAGSRRRSATGSPSTAISGRSRRSSSRRRCSGRRGPSEAARLLGSPLGLSATCSEAPVRG